MNITSIILLSILAICIILYILSFIKNWKIISGITSLFFIPLTCIPIILALNSYLPDSYRLRLLSILAITFISLSELFIYFNFTKGTNIAGELLYICSFLVWIRLYKTTYYVFNFTTTSTIIEGTILLALILSLFIYIGKQKLTTYLLRLFQFAGLGFLNYCGLLTISNVHRAYGYTLFIGSLFMLLEFFLFSVQTTKPVEINRKIEKLIRTLLMTSSEILITLTGLLMISN